MIIHTPCIPFLHNLTHTTFANQGCVEFIGRGLRMESARQKISLG